jgi:hypothetical protein
MACKSTTTKFIDPQTVVRLAQQAGFSGDSLVNITAITGHESGWGTDAVNDCPDTGDYSIGLGQINLFGDLLNGRIQQLQSLGYNVHSKADAVLALQDPLTNLRMAYLLGNGGSNLQPWAADLPVGNLSTYSVAQQVVNEVTSVSPTGVTPPNPTSSPGNTTPVPNGSSGGGTIPVVSGIGNIVTGIADPVGSAASDIGNAIVAPLAPIGNFFKVLLNPHTWFRLFFVLSGAAIMLVGAYLFATHMGDGGGGDAAKDIAKVGAIA